MRIAKLKVAVAVAERGVEPIQISARVRGQVVEKLGPQSDGLAVILRKWLPLDSVKTVAGIKFGLTSPELGTWPFSRSKDTTTPAFA